MPPTQEPLLALFAIPNVDGASRADLYLLELALWIEESVEAGPRRTSALEALLACKRALSLPNQDDEELPDTKR